MRLVSIVCPVRNEEQTIPILYERLQSVLAPLRQHYDFELIFTNNRSRDRTLQLILELREKDPSVQVLTLSRDFGYQASVLAGLSYAAGDGILVIDADCEDPPELIPQMIAKWEDGYDVVYGLRRNRPEWCGLILVRRLFYRVLKLMADADVIVDMAEFCLTSSHVRDVIISNRNTFPFLRTEIGYAGFSRYGIPYDRQPRMGGRTHYNLWAMVLFGVGGILSSSTFPMRFAAYVFPFIGLINVVSLFLELSGSLPGALELLVVFDIMYIISLLTVHGLYLARVYKNDVARPVFIVDSQLSHTNRPYLQCTRQEARL